MPPAPEPPPYGESGAGPCEGPVLYSWQCGTELMAKVEKRRVQLLGHPDLTISEDLTTEWMALLEYEVTLHESHESGTPTPPPSTPVLYQTPAITVLPGEKMGIRIMTTANGFRVVALTPGSPCELPGAIEVGDYVEQVNASTTHGLKHIEVVQLLRSAGSEFTLTLRREPGGSDGVEEEVAEGGGDSATTNSTSTSTTISTPPSTSTTTTTTTTSDSAANDNTPNYAAASAGGGAHGVASSRGGGSAFYAVVQTVPSDADTSGVHDPRNPHNINATPSTYPTPHHPHLHPHVFHETPNQNTNANTNTNTYNLPTASASAPTSPAHPPGLAGPAGGGGDGDGGGLVRSTSTWSTSSFGSASIASDDMRDASSAVAVLVPTTPPPTSFGTAAATARNGDTRFTSPLARTYSNTSLASTSSSGGGGGGGGGSSNPQLPLKGWLAAVSSQLSEEQQQQQQHALHAHLQQAGRNASGGGGGGGGPSSAVPTRGLHKSGRSSPIEQNAMGSNKFARLLDSTQISLLCTEDELKQLVLHRVKPRRGCRVKRVGEALATAGFKVSDVLVQVGSTVVLGAKPERVVRELRTCHSNGKGRVDVVVATSKEVDMLDCEILESLLVSVRSCTVSRPPGSGIGVSVVSRPNKMGSLVKSVVPGSPFAESQVTKNDMFLRIQGEPVLFLPHDEVARIIRAAGTTIDMSLGRADEVDAVMAELTKLRSKMDALSHSRSSSKAKKSGSGGGTNFMSNLLGRLNPSSAGDGGGGGGGGGNAADNADGSGGGEGQQHGHHHHNNHNNNNHHHHHHHHHRTTSSDSQIDDQDSTSGYISSDGSLRTSSSDFLLATPASSLSSIFDVVNDANTQDWLQEDQFDSGFYGGAPDIVMKHMDTSFESPERPQTLAAAAAAAASPPPRRPASAPPTAPTTMAGLNQATVVMADGGLRATNAVVATKKKATNNNNTPKNHTHNHINGDGSSSDSSSSSKAPLAKKNSNAQQSARKAPQPAASRSNGTSTKSTGPKKKATSPFPYPSPSPSSSSSSTSATTTAKTTKKLKKKKSSTAPSAHNHHRSGKTAAPFPSSSVTTPAAEPQFSAVDVQAAADVARAAKYGGVVMRGGAMAAAELKEFKETERSLFSYLEDKASAVKGVHTMSSEEYRAYCDLLTDGSITSSNYGSDDEDGDLSSNGRRPKRTRVNSTSQQVVPLWTSAMTDLREWLRENWAAAAVSSDFSCSSSSSSFSSASSTNATFSSSSTTAAAAAAFDGCTNGKFGKGKGKGKGKSSIPVKGKTHSSLSTAAAAAFAAAATLDADDGNDDHDGTFKMFKYKIFLAQLAAAKKRREEAEVLCSAAVTDLEGNLIRLFGSTPECLRDAYGHEAASSTSSATASSASSCYSPASSCQSSRSTSPAFGTSRNHYNGDGGSNGTGSVGGGGGGGGGGAGSAESIVLRTSAIPRATTNAAGTSAMDDPSAVGTALCKAVVSQLSRVEADRVKVFERQEAVHQLQDTALVAAHGVEVHFATVEEHSGIDFKVDHKCPYGLKGLQFVQNRDASGSIGGSAGSTAAAAGSEAEDDHTGKFVLTINGMFALGLNPEEAKVLLKVTKQQVLSLTLLPREELWAAAQIDWNLFNPQTNGWIPPPPASFAALHRAHNVDGHSTEDRRGPYRAWLGNQMAATNLALEFGTRPPLLARHGVLPALPDSVTGRRRTLSLSSNWNNIGNGNGTSWSERGRGITGGGSHRSSRENQSQTPCSERMVDELLIRVGEATKDSLEDVLKEAAARHPTVLQEMLTKMSGQGDINQDVLNGAMSAAASYAAGNPNPATLSFQSQSSQPSQSQSHSSAGFVVHSNYSNNAHPEQQQPVVYKWQSGRNMTSQIEARRAQLLALNIDQDDALVAEWMALLRVRATLTSFQDFQSAAEKSESWFKKTSVKSLLARFRKGGSGGGGGGSSGGGGAGKDKSTSKTRFVADPPPVSIAGDGKVWVGLASNNDSGICIEDHLPSVPSPSFTPPSSPLRQTLNAAMQNQRPAYASDYDPFATPTRPRYEQGASTASHAHYNQQQQQQQHNDATPVPGGSGVGGYMLPRECPSAPFASPPVQASTPDAATRARARARAEIARRRAIQTESVLV